MNAYDAAETAYKNGYKQGQKDAMDKIVFCKECSSHDRVSCSIGRLWCSTLSRYMKEDSFCSYGERKGNETT
jgi:hypothetical protein